MMIRWLILSLYLGDSLVSALTPFSSGVFAVVLVLLHWRRLVLTPSLRVVTWAVVAVVFGAIGGWLSGTPASGFFFATTALLGVLWVCGTSLRGAAAQIIEPSTAAAGVGVCIAFLLISLAGLDVFSAVTGTPTNRGAGLFQEPSHLSLYMMPLWFIAYQRSSYRPYLWVALAVTVLTCFSASLIAFMTIAFLLRMYAAKATGPRGRRLSIRRLAAGAAILFAFALPLPISVGDVPIQTYLGDRIGGLTATADSDTFNLSSLVLLQGVQLAYQSVISSVGFGVGLGNFGISEQIVNQSSFREIIRTVTGNNDDLSLRDGGVLINKLTGELGVLSVGVLLAFRRRLARIREVDSDAEQAYHVALAATLLCLLFVRALPYFAAPTCLAILSMAGLSPQGNVRKTRHRSPLPCAASMSSRQT